jgi:hypothetical protein
MLWAVRWQQGLLVGPSEGVHSCFRQVVVCCAAAETLCKAAGVVEAGSSYGYLLNVFSACCTEQMRLGAGW